MNFELHMWVVVKTRLTFGSQTIRCRIRVELYRIPQKDHNFDNYPCVFVVKGRFLC